MKNQGPIVRSHIYDEFPSIKTVPSFQRCSMLLFSPSTLFKKPSLKIHMNLSCLFVNIAQIADLVLLSRQASPRRGLAQNPISIKRGQISPRNQLKPAMGVMPSSLKSGQGLMICEELRREWPSCPGQVHFQAKGIIFPNNEEYAQVSLCI